MKTEILLQKIDKLRSKYRGRKFDIEEGNPYIEESCKLINQFKKEIEEQIAEKLDRMDYDQIDNWIKSNI